MNRRKFLGMGFASSLAAATGSDAKIASAHEEDVPRFTEREILTSHQLNRLVDEINRLKKATRGR